MKSSKGISKKSKTMDYTNYAYNEAVGRLKVMLADNSYSTPKLGGSSGYLRNFNEDSADNFSDNLSAIERPVYSDISKYLSPSQKSRMSSYRPKKSYGPTLNSTYLSASKENLAALYSNTPPSVLPNESVAAPVEIFNFIEKQEDYIEQLEKESKYCRSELTNLLGKVKDVINENEQLTENARTEFSAMDAGGGNKSKSQSNIATTSPSSDSDDHLAFGRKTAPSTPRKSNLKVQSPRYASAPNIVYEARISELEAELMQANIDLKRVKTENEELKRKMSYTDPLTAMVPVGGNCEAHRKQLEQLQQDKVMLEESVHQLQRLLDEAKSQGHAGASSKRYVQDLMQMERSQAELEVRHLRDELDRQHERVRELQHEMARRLAEERASAERRYNSQVDQLGGDLSSQWEQVTKLQLELERQKRYETDLKRDVANRNSQIEELKMELRANRTTFLADMAQVNAEKQSLEQEITSLRLQLDRAARETKTEAARLNAEINSLRQRLDRGDADLLHSKREILRLNDEIANLEKELAYGELKNEIRPTKKDLDKRISEMQDKHEPEMPLTIATIAQANENVNMYISPIESEVPKDQEDFHMAEETEILKNIIKSNERLAQELAKMPPLPKLSSHLKLTSSNSTTATAAAADKSSKCFCPSFMRHRYNHRHENNSDSNNETKMTCSKRSCNNYKSRTQPTTTTLHQCNKSKNCHKHVQHCTSTMAETHCCHLEQTEPLPRRQQHLVLNQSISSSCTTPPCQSQNLTVDAETKATMGTSSICKGRGSNALNASIKPKLYFEQLLQRNASCHQKTRPPVKVDVNVRLVPKVSKDLKTQGVKELNETFVKDVDDVANALNETFVTDSSSSPELLHIEEQLKKLNQAEQKQHIILEEADDEEQERTTKL
ncbi:serologically defined colon cancer antigen 8 homolog isoform X1 [Drosophila willistoni]|uniref:serologically defined colon cancer antigen 8 homolog isoform X1 n=1 Tax=Drosophila willistoni TaxID=7260 RepID=UPI001F085745|nr:serologically defined colon cancer antigen 8 homolog isoform X1 [Drosophila willistoni]